MENDDIIPDEEQDPDTSTGEQTTDEGSEPEETPSESDTVPYNRFKEVIEEKNQLKNDVEGLREDMENLKSTQPKAEEEEPYDWKEAEARTVKKAVTQIQEENQKALETKQEEDRAIEKSFEHLKAMGEDITPEVRRNVLTQMIKTGNEDVFDIYLQTKAKTDNTEKAEQRKEEGVVPNSQKGAEPGETGLSYNQLRGMSLDDIVEGAVEKPK